MAEELQVSVKLTNEKIQFTRRGQIQSADHLRLQPADRRRRGLHRP